MTTLIGRRTTRTDETLCRMFMREVPSMSLVIRVKFRSAGVIV